MPKNHNYYEPTEYEQMLIAARWISIEDIDEDYAKYARIANRKFDEGAMSYQSWQNCRKQWDELNTRFEALERQYGIGTVWDSEASDEVNQIVDEMMDLEVSLGY